MAQNPVVGIDYEVNVADAISGLNQLKQAIKDNKQAFNDSVSGMNNWKSTSDGLEKKVSSLKQQLQLQGQVVENYKAQIKALQSAEGDHSSEIDKLKNKLSTAENAYNSTANQLGKYESQLGKVQAQEEREQSALGQLEAKHKAAADAVEQLGDAYKQALAEGDADKVAEISEEIKKQQAIVDETEAELRQYDEALDDVTGGNNEADDSTNALSGSMTEFASTLSVIKQAWAKVSEAVQVVIEKYGEYDTASRQLAATMGITDVEGLEEQIKNAGIDMTQYGYTLTDTTTALNYFALAGWDLEDSLQVVGDAMEFAYASGGDMSTVIDALTDSMTALGLKNEEMGQLTDTMVYVQNHANTTASMMSESYLALGATIQGTGDDAYTAAAALGVLGNNGIKGSEAGKHLRNMFLKLQTPTADAQKALDKYGVSVYDSEGNMRSLFDIMTDINNIDFGTSEAKNSFLSELFNTTDLAGVNSLLNSLTDGTWEILLKGTVEDSSGSVEQAAETLSSGVEGQLAQVQAKWDELIATIGDIFSPAIATTLEGILNVLDWTNTWLSGIKQWLNPATITEADRTAAINLSETIGYERYVPGDESTKGYTAFPDIFTDQFTANFREVLENSGTEAAQKMFDTALKAQGYEESDLKGFDFQRDILSQFGYQTQGTSGGIQSGIAAGQAYQASQEKTFNKSNKEEAVAVQQRLNELLDAELVTDGIIGVKSQEQIAAWQKKQGYEETGVLTMGQYAELMGEAADEAEGTAESVEEIPEEKTVTVDTETTGETSTDGGTVTMEVQADTTQAQQDIGQFEALNANDNLFAQLQINFPDAEYGEISKKFETLTEDKNVVVTAMLASGTASSALKSLTAKDYTATLHVKAPVISYSATGEPSQTGTRRFARGGIIDRPTYALMGEAGREAVMPLENNTGWISELASRLNGYANNFGSERSSVTNNSSNVSVTGNSFNIRNEDDITALARQIASLSNDKQRLRGGR